MLIGKYCPLTSRKVADLNCPIKTSRFCSCFICYTNIFIAITYMIVILWSYIIRFYAIILLRLLLYCSSVESSGMRLIKMKRTMRVIHCRYLAYNTFVDFEFIHFFFFTIYSTRSSQGELVRYLACTIGIYQFSYVWNNILWYNTRYSSVLRYY